MANLYSGSAFDALNEKEYINKLYGNNASEENKLIGENYKDNTGFLDSEKTRVENQTQENLDRTQVEAQTAKDKYTGPQLTLGAQQQEDLLRENARMVNESSLKQNQNDIEAEIERQRQLLASQYEAAIKQAQAENDMEKAQALYNAAKADEEKLNAMRMDFLNHMAEGEEFDAEIFNAVLNASGTGGGSFGGFQGFQGFGEKGDSEEYESGRGFGQYRGFGGFGNGRKQEGNGSQGSSWSEVLKNEADINAIYDAQAEAERIGIQSEWEKAISDLLAKQLQQQEQTDQNLSKAYVDNLQKIKNYAEVQSAYGQGSGTAGAARIAQDTQGQKDLTELRLGQMNADAGFGADRLNVGTSYGEQMRDAMTEVNRQRAEALLDAAEREENMLIDQQNLLAQTLAGEGDFSLLAQLMGIPAYLFEQEEEESGGGGEPSSGSKPASKKKVTLEDSVDKLLSAGASENDIASYLAAEDMWKRHS